MTSFFLFNILQIYILTIIMNKKQKVRSQCLDLKKKNTLSSILIRKNKNKKIRFANTLGKTTQKNNKQKKQLSIRQKHI